LSVVIFHLPPLKDVYNSNVYGAAHSVFFTSRHMSYALITTHQDCAQVSWLVAIANDRSQISHVAVTSPQIS
jgi:hypothetical protein